MPKNFERPITSEVSNRPPIKRSFPMTFTQVVRDGSFFYFYISGELICGIDEMHFSHLQKTFFDAISDP